jgi:vacuolar-type H+-ATPase subunit I/STV1
MGIRMKGFAINDLVSVVLTFVLIGIIAAMGLYVNTQVGTVAGFNMTSSPSGNAISNATLGISVLMSWLPIIAIIVAAGLIISLLVGAFMMKQGGV